MPVYVDDAQIPYGRMKMSHMLADTRAELFDMADAIGLNRRHLQNVGQPNEHFDVSGTYRSKALTKGAVAVDSRGLAKLIRKRRKGGMDDYLTEPSPPKPQKKLLYGRAKAKEADDEQADSGE